MTRSYQDLQTEWDCLYDTLDNCRLRIQALEARLGLLIPGDLLSLYTDRDIHIFQTNWTRLQHLLEDDDFMNMATQLVNHVDADTYNAVHQYIQIHYPGYVIQICDSCNGILFLSEKTFDTDIFSWNVGARSEIILSMIANATGCSRSIPFFQDLINQGFGYSKRTRFMDARQLDTNEYHFICKQTIIGDRILFVALRESSSSP